MPPCLRGKEAWCLKPQRIFFIPLYFFSVSRGMFWMGSFKFDPLRFNIGLIPSTIVRDLAPPMLRHQLRISISKLDLFRFQSYGFKLMDLIFLGLLIINFRIYKNWNKFLKKLYFFLYFYFFNILYFNIHTLTYENKRNF